MHIKHLGEKVAGRAIDDAIAGLLSTGRIDSLKAGATPTDALGDMVIEQLRAD